MTRVLNNRLSFNQIIRAMKFDKRLQKEQDKELMRDLNVIKDELKTLKKKLAKVAPRSERGVETLFRLASKNHYTSEYHGG